MVIENVILLIALTYIVSLCVGYVIEKKARIPWMFSALFFGIFLSSLGLLKDVIKSETFQVFSNIGMLMLLFLIGFNLNLKKIRRLGKYVFFGSFFIIIFEGFFGSLLLYFGFPAEVGNSYLVALITSLSFATVGEAILLPILAEFEILSTTFGQLTLGIGTIDDVIEVLLLFFLSLFPEIQSRGLPSHRFNFFTLFFFVTFVFSMLLMRRRIKSKLKRISSFPLRFFTGIALLTLSWRDWVQGKLTKLSKAHTHHLLVLVIFFSFVALSEIVSIELSPVAAIIAGIIARQLSPPMILPENEKVINFFGYVFLSPLFFLSIGSEVSIHSLFLAPLLIVGIWLVSNGSKLLASYLLFHHLLGKKYSLLMGLGLSVRFSTSLVVQSILFDRGFISSTLFSALIATAILMKPVIITTYSWFLAKEKPP